MRFIFSHFPPCVPPRLKFDWKLQSVKTKEVLFFFKYACSVQIILSGRIFDLGCLREIIITQQFFWLAFSAALPVLTNRRAVRLPLWIMLLLKKQNKAFLLELQNSKLCRVQYFQRLLECYEVSSSSVTVSEKDQVRSAQCALDLEKPRSSFLPNRRGIIF